MPSYLLPHKRQNVDYPEASRSLNILAAFFIRRQIIDFPTSILSCTLVTSVHKGDVMNEALSKIQHFISMLFLVSRLLVCHKSYKAQNDCEKEKLIDHVLQDDGNET